MNPFGCHCDDFHFSCYLNTELELPKSRDTVLHFFEQVSKAFPRMTNFFGRENNEYVLEEDKDTGSHRWMTLEGRRIASGYVNPPSLDAGHPQHELMLDLAPHLLSVSPLDCEAVDVSFGFDFIYKGNHDEVVCEALARESRIESLLGIAGSRVVNYEPTLTIALDDQCRLQCRLNIVTRTNTYQVRTGQYADEPISVYFTVRQYWGVGTDLSFVQSYRRQVEIAQEVVAGHVLPSVVAPLADAISAR